MRNGRKLGFNLFLFSIITISIVCCNNSKVINSTNLPKKFPLKTGNTWVYKNLVYSKCDTICTYDTLCILGKYKDYYKYTEGYGRISLVKNKYRKLLSYGYIQLSDTIHGIISGNDTTSYKEPIILKADTIYYGKPLIKAIFTIDTGYVSIDTLSQKFMFSSHIDSFHVSIERDYKYKNNSYDSYVFRYLSKCPGVYCRYDYYTKIGLVYNKAISKNKKNIVQEIILENVLKDYYMKNIRTSENNKYY